MKVLMFSLVAAFGMNVHAARTPESLTQAQFFLVAEVLSGEPAVQEDEDMNQDDAGTEEGMERFAQRVPDQYASIHTPRSHYVGGATGERSACSPQYGVASWYGGSFQGRKTANGETFDTNSQTDLTAAHKTLPMGTRVRVTNRKNGLSIVVRINDRGPFVAGRVIDVTSVGARALHLDGVGPVQLTCL